MPLSDSSITATPGGEAAAAALDGLPEWRLDDLYKGMDDPRFLADREAALKDSIAFESDYQDTLADRLESPGGGRTLAAAIARYEALEDRLGRLKSFASLVYSTDTTDPARGKFLGDVDGHVTTASAHLLFFPLELNALDDAALEAAMVDPALARYRPWLVDLRKDKPYQLDARTERLFHEKSVTGSSAWIRLFDETIAGLEVGLDGKEVPIEVALDRLQHPDGAVRKAAAEALGETLDRSAPIFTLITNTLAKDKEISDRWHGFEDVADSRHLRNRVERPVVDALVEAVRDAYPRLSHRYYRLKARWFGMEKMPYWDRNAPLPEADTAAISWDMARRMVLDAYARFSPDMAEIAGRFFDRSWIDAAPRQGKAQGAFSHPTVPSAHPYVLMNYRGKPRDVMTLAHELGHGVHQILAAPQGALMAPTPLTLAETASVFGEALTFRSLMETVENENQRRVLLASRAEDMLNTVVRQIAFYTFERRVHEARREGELTAEALGDIWMGVQTESLGDVFRFDDSYRNFWTYIPHFIHAPFYVYSYAFGYCLVNSLFAVYQESESGFQERYFELLKAGGTKHHKELLAPFGLDASDPSFWARGLRVVEGLIDELEALPSTSGPL